MEQVAQCRSYCLLVQIWLLYCRFWLTVFCPVKMLLLVAKISISLSLLYFTLLYYTIDLLYIQVKPEKIEYRAKVH